MMKVAGSAYMTMPKLMATQPIHPYCTPLRNQGLIAGLIKGNQWLISP